MILTTVALNVALPLLVGALLLVFVRLVRGPHVLDRVVALDYIAIVGVGILAIYAVATGQTAYLDVAVIVALLGFLGTVGFAYYVERRTNA
ncbi:MAG: monovalent cation/H+ antiporter complex subunit F [Caldilineaceae bacterium]